MRLTPAPLPFTIGLVLGLFALSWLGSVVESTRLAERFVRFHQLLSAESDYYLLPWPPRDRLLDGAWRGTSALRTPALGSLFDAYLNFNDLWNFVGYEYANSNWNRRLVEHAFEPR